MLSTQVQGYEPFFRQKNVLRSSKGVTARMVDRETAVRQTADVVSSFINHVSSYYSHSTQWLGINVC